VPVRFNSLISGALLAVACGPGGSDSAMCNGHSALCDLALTEITLPGTHNSMSNADAGWFFPNQQHGIGEQLDAGVRALMLDTTEWEGEPTLCHSDCDLGSQPLSEGLDEIESFLAAQPREVVLIIFQDDLSPAVTVEVMRSVGLADRVWTWDGASALPTLTQMIDADTRLIVTAEFSGPPPAWYHYAWDLITDTPYDYTDAEQFSCAPNRGDSESPLFLVNHWLTDPVPTESYAAEVNAESVLGARASQCGAERERRVNVLAVDFYNVGDLFAVVDTLNGI
jgi:hypothetical protein